jgi:hypothetical protein
VIGLQVDVGDRSVLVPSAWIDRVDRLAQRVRLVVDRAQVRASPPFSGRGSPGPNLGCGQPAASSAARRSFAFAASGASGYFRMISW